MSTAFVTVSDLGYFNRATKTINDLRTTGKWTGDIVLIAIDMSPPSEFIKEYGIKVVSFPKIDITQFLNYIREKPISIPTCDGREWTKQNQWEKLHVFDTWFKQWERIIYLDAGLRMLDDVSPFLELDWRGKFLAPDDDLWELKKPFSEQVELVNWPDKLTELQNVCPGICEGRYFLNCIWIYDTSIPINKEEFIDIIGKYPLWRTNEMGVMNVVINFMHNLWTAFPLYTSTGKILFDWSERGGARWNKYCALKYPVTL
jgi:hypothetical protein